MFCSVLYSQVKKKMSKINEALNSATMFIEQIEQEFSDLITSYHIGSPRKEGIFYKVNGVKDALLIIDKETKIVPVPKIVEQVKVVSAPVIPPQPRPVATPKKKEKQ